MFGNVILENLKIMNVKKFIYFTTVWENFNAIKNNYFNLYAAYKSSFKNIILFYNKEYKKIKFYNLSISDTFGKLDQRKKIINVLKKKYKKNITTKIVSKFLYLNILNVEDIIDAIKILTKKNLKSENFVLKNYNSYSINQIISKLNKTSYKKVKIKWESKSIIKEKIYRGNKLKNWYPNKSKIDDIINLIKK